MNKPPSYEAFCPSCRVSHPPGTRQCVHCGGPVMKERPDSLGRLRETVPEVGVATGPDGFSSPDPLETGDAEDAARKPPGAVRIIVSLVWIAIAVGISIYRGCQGGG